MHIVVQTYLQDGRLRAVPDDGQRRTEHETGTDTVTHFGYSGAHGTGRRVDLRRHPAEFATLANAAVKDGRVKGTKLLTHSTRGRRESCLKGSMHRASLPGNTEKLQLLQVPDDILENFDRHNAGLSRVWDSIWSRPMEQHALGGYTGFYAFVCMHTMAIWVELYQQLRRLIRLFATSPTPLRRSSVLRFVKYTPINSLCGTTSALSSKP